MNTNPKIIVLKMREIIYTLLLLFLVALLIVCLILMFAPKSDETGQVHTQSTGNPQASQNQGQTADRQNLQTPGTQTAETQNRPSQSTQTTEAQNRQPQSAQTTEAQNRSSQNTSPTEAQNHQTRTTSQTSQPQTTQATSAQAQQQASPQAISAVAQSRYTPGVYTSPVMLGESAVDVEVTVDENRINSIRLVNLSETTAAAFPLVSPSLDHIAEQILETQSLEGITCPSENKYTSQLLLSAVSDALAIAGAK